MDLYVDNEHHDGYLRDGCVWSEEIDIYDKMAAQIQYANGVQVSYSCTTYSPYEGYRIAFNGTRGPTAKPFARLVTAAMAAAAEDRESSFEYTHGRLQQAGRPVPGREPR